MKIRVLLLLLLLCCLAGCQNKENVIHELNFDTSKCVELCDYRDVVISSDDLQISESDIDAVISMELATKAELKEIQDRTEVRTGDIAVLNIHIETATQIKSIEDFYYEVGSDIFGESFDKKLLLQKINESFSFLIKVPDSFPEESIIGEDAQWEITIGKLLNRETKLTDDLSQQLYGVPTVQQAKEKISESIIIGRKFDLAYQKILASSKIRKMPEIYDEILNKALSSATAESKEDIKTEVQSFFSEYIVLKAITEQEGNQYTQEDWEQTLERLIQETDLSEEEILDQYGSVGICYEMMYNDVKSILPKYVEVH